MRKKVKGIKNQQTGRAGEFFVAAELNRLGANAVTFAGNMPGIDILANRNDKVVQIQVKSKREGTWQTSYKEGRKSIRPHDNRFWVFVDLKPAAPEFYIVPDHWIRRNIYEFHQKYLRKYGGRRKSGSESTHHSIEEKRIREFKGKWSLLGLGLIDFIC
jgi:hypothetical protein